MKDNYPMLTQLERKNAPWNQEEQSPQEIEVTVSITLSKTVKVKVTDYVAEQDMGEDGYPDTHYDFSECDLKSAVKDQVALPSDKFKDWTVDDFETILEE